ncbi:MAG TPA: zf-HC2 domain-containing protein, partial [Anaeromyxobacteraceae bacterium]|nr:zf-HC2 domain-containing protein [Anaeromyxobacteraceae bacterium]
MSGAGPHVGEDLTALLDGALPEERRAEVEAHLAGCAACRTLRDDLARTLSVLSALPRPAPPAAGFEQRFYARLARERPRRRSFLDRFLVHPLRWLVPATGVAAALLVGAWGKRTHERGGRDMGW